MIDMCDSMCDMLYVIFTRVCYLVAITGFTEELHSFKLLFASSRYICIQRERLLLKSMYVWNLGEVQEVDQ